MLNGVESFSDRSKLIICFPCSVAEVYCEYLIFVIVLMEIFKLFADTKFLTTVSLVTIKTLTSLVLVFVFRLCLRVFFIDSLV